MLPHARPARAPPPEPGKATLRLMTTLSITTDYATGTGCPEPYLRRIADAGFTHVHWCHQWNTDFAYDECEVRQIGKWLREYGLRLTDLHGSAGPEKNWCSTVEYERQAGVELVKNRVCMAHALGGDVVIMHIPAEPDSVHEAKAYWERLRRSLDAVESEARPRGIRIALENLTCPGTFDTLETLFPFYGPDYLGLCYDAGHGNVSGDGLQRLAGLKDRLISVHLHDNDGSGDQHRLPFSGTVDWGLLARSIAGSAYAKPLSFEVAIRGHADLCEADFLAQAHRAGLRLEQMRSGVGGQR